MGKSNQPINANNYDLLVSSRNVKVLGLENPIFIVGLSVILLIALLYWFFGTELGSSLRATGSNPNMARAQGINTGFTTVLGLMLSNGLVALSSALLAQYQGFADVSIRLAGCVVERVEMASRYLDNIAAEAAKIVPANHPSRQSD
jgi:putative ABC transport system permease protein